VESGAGVTDILEDTDEAENSGGRDRKPAGKLSLLGDLAAGIAHEINNPVAIMLEEAGWIEDLLQEEEFRPSENLEEFKRALTQIKTQGARCKAIIQNLVSFGQKTSLKVGEVHVNDLVAGVVRTYDKRLRAGNVKIDTRFAESLPDCRLSPSEMQQVLSNLINNALDAVDPRSGRVSVSTRRDGQDVVIDVSDNGPGIPKAHLDKIFDPFLQLNASVKVQDSACRFATPSSRDHLAADIDGGSGCRTNRGANDG
jgi:two-component system NtrC family sensor kinase